MREFTLAGFAGHLTMLAAEMAIHEHEGLEKAAVIIENEAKASLGHYQDQAGPFAAWAELAEATKTDRASQGFPDNEPELRTGAMGLTIEHTVVGSEAYIGSDDQILEYQELGTAKMPPRSILGGAAVRKTNEVLVTLGTEVVGALVGAEVVAGGLKVIGD